MVTTIAICIIMANIKNDTTAQYVENLWCGFNKQMEAGKLHPASQYTVRRYKLSNKMLASESMSFLGSYEIVFRESIQYLL